MNDSAATSSHRKAGAAGDLHRDLDRHGDAEEVGPVPAGEGAQSLHRPTVTRLRGVCLLPRDDPSSSARGSMSGGRDDAAGPGRWERRPMTTRSPFRRLTPRRIVALAAIAAV